MNKIIISCGHTPSGTIGCGAIDLLNESICTREVGELVNKKLKEVGIDSILLRFDRGNSYLFEDCYTRAKQANNIGADLFVEIHFNSGMGRRGDGCEVLTTSSSSLAKNTADSICKALSASLQITNRGIKNNSVIVLSHTNMPAILVECMFVDGENANERYDAEVIANAIVKGITGVNVSTKYLRGWNHDETGYFYSPDGNTYYSNCWKQIKESDGLDYYYKFDTNGYMHASHWFYENNKWYYVNNGGGMVQARLPEVIKWEWINGDCYAFGTDGILYTDCVTYDGYTVDKDGKWIQNIPRK